MSLHEDADVGNSINEGAMILKSGEVFLDPTRSQLCKGMDYPFEFPQTVWSLLKTTLNIS